MNDIAFSVLVPAIPSRWEPLGALVRNLCGQAAGHDGAEILVWMDNKRRSIGCKRDDLVQAAHGEYLAFVDDDDGVPDDYVETALNQIAANPGTDVFTFEQSCWYNGLGPFTVTFGLGNPDEEMHLRPEGGNYADIRRAAGHSCIWRAEIAKSVRFEDWGYFEDTQWAEQLRKRAEREVFIPRVMHLYRYDDLVSEGHDWK